jgi:hypothetical protein
VREDGPIFPDREVPGGLVNSLRESLRALGLEEYVELVERERELRAARHQSDADLRELGLPLG